MAAEPQTQQTPPSESPSEPPAPQEAEGSGFMHEVLGLGRLLGTVAFALALAFTVQAFVVKPYRIPSESMVPTLEVGERILVNRIGERLGDPGVGDVVVFHPPKGADGAPQACAARGEGAGTDTPCSKEVGGEADVAFVKRIVGGPGDRLRIVNGVVERNGVKENRAAVRCGSGECTFSQSIVVPAGHYYLMGDNRGASDDSRFWGPVRRDWIIGKAFATYWPPKRIGPL